MPILSLNALGSASRSTFSARHPVSGGSSARVRTSALSQKRPDCLQASAVPWFPPAATALFIPPQLEKAATYRDVDAHATAAAAGLAMPILGLPCTDDAAAPVTQLDSSASLGEEAPATAPAAPSPAASTAASLADTPRPSTAPSTAPSWETQPPSAATSAAPSAAPSVAPSVAQSVAFTDRSSSRGNEHNSVTIKAETNVKDAAGAAIKVLNRMYTLVMTALNKSSTDRSHEALNQAVKVLAVARKYLKDWQPQYELAFLPFNRTSGGSPSNCEVESGEAAQPLDHLFAFLVYKTVVDVALLEADKTDLCVRSGGDPNKMANAIISVILDRGQAVMKLGGIAAMFVAMSAVVNARTRVKRKHGFDLMVIPQWITEDTRATLGRESKFLRFNILKCDLNGPLEHSVRPARFA